MYKSGVQYSAWHMGIRWLKRSCRSGWLAISRIEICAQHCPTLNPLCIGASDTDSLQIRKAARNVEEICTWLKGKLSTRKKWDGDAQGKVVGKKWLCEKGRFLKVYLIL